MVGEVFTERRRTPRVTVTGHAMAAVTLSLPVRVLNIGATGMLLQSIHPIASGGLIRLSMLLGRDAWSVPLEIRRQVPSEERQDGETQFELGAATAFADAAERQRFKRALDSMLGAGPGEHE